MIWIIVAAIAALVAAAAIAIHRGLHRLEGEVHEAWVALDAQLRKREEHMTRMAALCGRLMHEEPETLDRARAAGMAVLAAASRADMPALSAALEAQRAAASDLLTVAGSYPQLASSTAFAALVARADELESRVAARCEQYNAAAIVLNVRRGAMPHRLVAKLTGVRQAGLLSA